MPPSHIIVADVTISSITISWGMVECIHRNGDITGYSVQFSEHGNQMSRTQFVPGEATTHTISALTPSTSYNIKVAAVNKAGIGVYSTQTTTFTFGELFS